MKYLWIGLRPKTLTAAVVPIAVAGALGISRVTLSAAQIMMIAFALLSALCIQIATNLLNDAIDFKKGADTDKRLGPTRITQSGMMTPKKVFGAGIGFILLALLFGIPLVHFGGLPIMIVGIVSLFMAYSYTGGPFPLAYLGLGDLFVFIFFGLVSVLGMEFILLKQISMDAVVAGAQIGLLCTILIAINNLRDVSEDSKTKKKTLAVRFGVWFVRTEILLLGILPFLFGAYWWFVDKQFAAFLPLIVLPLSIHIITKVWVTAPSKEYNRYLAKSSLLHLGFGLLLSVGLILK